MKILAHTPLIISRKGFPRNDNGEPYLPGYVVTESIISSLIYYYVKRDREIGSKVKKYLLKEGLHPEEVKKHVKKIIFEKFKFDDVFRIPEIIRLRYGKLYETIVEIFDLKKWEEVDYFRVEVFEGTIDVSMSEELVDRIKPAAQSFANALLRMEKEFLKGHPLNESFYVPMSNEIKKWYVPLRLGLWAEVKYSGNLLFFWKIKEVRDRFLRDYKVDIRPSRVFLLPREGVTPGWAELRKEV